MKIISYNINGLNAFTNKGWMRNIIDDFKADVYCFQEIKMNNDEKIISKLNESFETTPNYEKSVNHVKNGYAGVMDLFNNINYCPKKENVSEMIFPINEGIQELYKYIPGRILTVEYDDFYLVNVYVLNSGNKEEMRKQFDKYFRGYIRILDIKKPVIVVGDFNACATELDYWGDYDNAIDSYPGLMQFEIDGFHKLCDECELVDAFRYKHGDERTYSWYPPNWNAIDAHHGWRLDYCLVSKRFIDHIEDATIHDSYQTPDHCPIEIIVK